MKMCTFIYIYLAKTICMSSTQSTSLGLNDAFENTYTGFEVDSCTSFISVKCKFVNLTWLSRNWSSSSTTQHSRHFLCSFAMFKYLPRSLSGMTMPMSRHSVGTFQETSSHATRQGNSVTIISACWATVDWSWPKEWNLCAQAKLHFKKKSAGGE